MKQDLIVIIGASKPHGLMRLYLQQLEQAAIDCHAHTLTTFKNTLEFQIAEQRKLVERFSHFSKIVLTDAWDVVFYGSRVDVLRKIPDSGVLLAAERNCFPDKSIADRFPGDTAWRFVNGGMLCGTPQSILDWYSALEGHPLYEANRSRLNQYMLNALRIRGSPLTPIDDRTELFYCMHLEKNELQFEADLPVNTVLGTHPNFLHFNGNWPSAEILARRRI